MPARRAAETSPGPGGLGAHAYRAWRRPSDGSLRVKLEFSPPGPPTAARRAEPAPQASPPAGSFSYVVCTWSDRGEADRASNKNVDRRLGHEPRRCGGYLPPIGPEPGSAPSIAKARVLSAISTRRSARSETGKARVPGAPIEPVGSVVGPVAPGNPSRPASPSDPSTGVRLRQCRSRSCHAGRANWSRRSRFSRAAPREARRHRRRGSSSPPRSEPRTSGFIPIEISGVVCTNP